MSKREQLNKLLNEEKVARATVEQLCNEWEWTLSDKEATIVNNIVINKGKVVEVPVVKETVIEVPVVKETVVDNTDIATIEKLNARIKELEEDNDKLYKLYLEEQREKEAWAAAHADLKDECSALRNSYGELDEAYELLVDGIANRNNRIEDLKIEIDNLKAQNNSLEEELMEAESQNMVLEGKVIGYEMDIKRLKAKMNKPSIVIDDEEFDEEPEEKPVVKETKEETKSTTTSHKNVEAVDITLYDVRKTHDGVRGRTDNYEFAWAIGKNIPAYKPNGGKAWKPMTGSLYTEARYIMSTLRNFMEQVKTEVEAKDKKKNNRPERTTKIQKEEPKQNEQVKKEVNTKEEKQDNKPERTTKIRKEEKQNEQKNTVNTKEKNIYKANDNEVDTLGNTDEMEFC